MAEEWLTYSALGERLGVSPEAARQKALRLGLRKQTRNDGKVQVLVDAEDVKATTTPRKPKDEADDDTTAEEQPSDARALDALEAHIETLKAMAERAEANTRIERERADTERARADGERARADAERGRGDELQRRVNELLADEAGRAEMQAKVNAEIEALKAIVADLGRPWWKRRRA